MAVFKLNLKDVLKRKMIKPKNSVKIHVTIDEKVGIIYIFSVYLYANIAKYTKMWKT